MSAPGRRALGSLIGRRSEIRRSRNGRARSRSKISRDRPMAAATSVRSVEDGRHLQAGHRLVPDKTKVAPAVEHFLIPGVRVCCDLEGRKPRAHRDPFDRDGLPCTRRPSCGRSARRSAAASRRQTATRPARNRCAVPPSRSRDRARGNVARCRPTARRRASAWSRGVAPDPELAMAFPSSAPSCALNSASVTSPRRARMVSSTALPARNGPRARARSPGAAR